MIFAQNVLRSALFQKTKLIRLESAIWKRHASISTIFSLASGFGKCGVAVIRVSGPETKNVLTQMIGTGATSKPFELQPRYAALRKFHHPKTRQLIDEGLVLWFPGPRSFTGEDSCEFHVHGGLAVISAMNEAINSVNGVRPSLPGEFTKRAFYANKMDLTEVEGLADLIHAETEVQRKQALLQAQGVISKLYNNWRERLIKIIAYVETYIDFHEDQNIEDDLLANIERETRAVIVDIENYLKDSRKGEMRRIGIKTVILGAPNVGKSSFMNHICRKPISIVANVPGTTRDIIESSFNIAGYPILLADTAGLRKHTNDPIETEGISRAVEHARNADLIILIMDANQLSAHGSDVRAYQAEYMSALGLEGHAEISDKPCLIVVNKIDLLSSGGNDNEAAKYLKDKESVAFISCKESIGLTEALTKLEDILKKLCGDPLEGNLTLSNERHRHLLIKCLEHLMEFEEEFVEAHRHSSADIDYAILAAKLRKSVHSIGYITGTIHPDEMLDVIFREFCIGK